MRSKIRNSDISRDFTDYGLRGLPKSGHRFQNTMRFGHSSGAGFGAGAAFVAVKWKCDYRHVQKVGLFHNADLLAIRAGLERLVVADELEGTLIQIPALDCRISVAVCLRILVKLATEAKGVRAIG